MKVSISSGALKVAIAKLHAIAILFYFSQDFIPRFAHDRII